MREMTSIFKGVTTDLLLMGTSATDGTLKVCEKKQWKQKQRREKTIKMHLKDKEDSFEEKASPFYLKKNTLLQY